MRRPKKTKKQIQYEREQRALLTLRRAAVFYAASTELAENGQLGDEGATGAVLAGANVEAAALRYVEMLPMRERTKLLGMRFPKGAQ